MSSVNALLTERLKKSERSSKIAALAKQSASGQLTSFAGVFQVSELSVHEKSELETILHEFTDENANIHEDLNKLVAITAEVKAINNQAALLHGERIKKVQKLLKNYREGAFTAWLVSTYGNRQTPYNFLQYFEFHEAMPKELRTQIEVMPRQAIYTLASREGSIKDKQHIVENFKGQTKAELLSVIRETFPLQSKDKRRSKPQELILRHLMQASYQVLKYRSQLSTGDRKAIREHINHLLRDLS
jgi:predicted RNase H-like nuclease